MSYRVSLFTVLLSLFVVVSLPLWCQNVPEPGDLANMQPGLPGNPGSMPGDRGPSMADPGYAMSRMDYCTITGTVSTSDHRPAANARVELRNEETGAILASGYTGPTGSFRVSGIPRGSYEVIASLGISEARESVEAMGVDDSVNLTLPHTDNTTSGQDMVSVAELRVPDKAKDQLRKAQEAFNKGKTTDALKGIQKALKIYPQYADAFVLRGIMHIDGENLDAAIDDFQQALRCDPSAVMAYIGTGAVFNMQGRFDEALRELDRGVALQPASWQAEFEIAKANLGKGNFQAALTHVNRAQELSADQFYPVHLIKAHAFLGLKDYSAAIPELEKFLSKDRNGPESASARQELDEAKAFVTTASAGK
jgi:Tfp pilus assembly protein PilF